MRECRAAAVPTTDPVALRTGSPPTSRRSGLRVPERLRPLTRKVERAPSRHKPARPPSALKEEWLVAAGTGGRPLPRARRKPACATVAAAGSATVELAAAIPLLVAVTLAMVGVLGLARDQVLAQGAAREGAREAAIGGDQTRASAAARAALPPGRAARVTVTAAGADRVRVLVELPVRLPFGGSPVVIRATAVAAREPGPAPLPADS